MLALVSGCKVGPDYHRPAAVGTNAIPQDYSGASGSNSLWKAAVPSAHLPHGSWWELFEDVELARLESLAAANSPELSGALARFEQARAQIDVSRAELFPQIDAVPSYNRQRTSFNEPENGHAAGQARTYNTFTLPFQAGWELDLWGRVRRQVESARASAEASADDLESTRLALQAELATDYFTLRALDREYDVVIRTTETFTRSLELTINRRKGGIATDLDVSLAETQLRSAEAELPALRLQRSRLLHAIATLCGQPATGFIVAHSAPDKLLDPLVPPGLPSELLERRPDVAAAEQRMASANAQIGVAQSAFFPRIRLDGLAGLQSVSVSTWLEWPSRFWSIGPTIDLPVFTGGRNRGQLAVSKAAYQSAVASYRHTVLTAFQEVEDQLAAQQHLTAQIAAETSALEAAQRTVGIANNRYKAGLVTYLEVASAQSAALSLERTVVQLQGQKRIATVGLIKAIGGGWQADRTAENKEMQLRRAGF
ncbi:MAG TPA: efflux transporter outer membrane subunit [Patescibacteria group bacterium]|nr:efflux transporter outer membrane subunit [Patescibacteria group bacterium]